MRCIGAENPPCLRCSKSGRYCDVPPSNQHHHQQQQPTPVHAHSVQSSSLTKWDSTAPAPSAVPSHRITQSTPGHHARPPLSRSITTPSLSIVSSIHTSPSRGPLPSPRSSICNSPRHPPQDYAAINLGLAQAHNDSGDHVTSSHYSHECATDAAHKLPSDEELRHLCRFFSTNLLVHVPVLTELDLSDLGALVKFKRPLAYSIAYVASQFVPGCKAIRNMLTPTVVSIAKLQFGQLDHLHLTDEDRWVLLQALAVLYCWAPTRSLETATNSRNSTSELNQESLKASMESLALHYSLHRSAQEIVGLLKRGEADRIHHTFAFRKYTYWLWLFTLAHFRSLISQTPPTIREDASITQAAQLLEGIATDASVRRIIARVELCLIWLRAGLRERDLGEWWCTMSTQIDLETALAALGDLDAALQVWRRKWCPPPGELTSRDDINNLGHEFQYHYTHFCISMYVAQLFHSSHSAEALPLSMMNLVMKAIERASTFCHFFLDLSPLAKSSVGFSVETTFAMLASSCEYTIQVQRWTAEPELAQQSQTRMIVGVAELMIDLGVDDKHNAKVIGHNILAKLTATKPVPQPKKPVEQPKQQAEQPRHQVEHWQTPQQQPQHPSHHRSNSQTPITTSSESLGAQALMSFAAFSDESWPSVHASMGHWELMNGEQHGLGINMGSNDGGGGNLWPVAYHGSEPIVGSNTF